MEYKKNRRRSLRRHHARRIKDRVRRTFSDWAPDKDYRCGLIIEPTDQEWLEWELWISRRAKNRKPCSRACCSPSRHWHGPDINELRSLIYFNDWRHEEGLCAYFWP